MLSGYSTLAKAENVTVYKNQANSVSDYNARNHNSINILHDYSKQTLQEKTRQETFIKSMLPVSLKKYKTQTVP